MHAERATHLEKSLSLEIYSQAVATAFHACPEHRTIQGESGLQRSLA